MPENAGMHKEKRRTIREVFADNVKARMAKDSTIATQTLLAAKAGVDQGHLSRLLSCGASPTIDLLDQIARGCRCQAWELLVDGEATREDAFQRILRG